MPSPYDVVPFGIMDIRVDGRTTRWQAHNIQRRAELVDAALRAIRRHGPLVGMDEIAHEAATSKPVIYRHFGDKNGLYSAIVDVVSQRIWEQLGLEDPAKTHPRQLVRALADTYLGLVENEPEIYQFVISRPANEEGQHPLTGITTRIGDRVSELFRAWLTSNGLDPEPANIWGHGVVGFTRAVAARWIVTDLRRPRADAVDYIDRLLAPTFEAMLGQEPVSLS